MSDNNEDDLIRREDALKVLLGYASGESAQKGVFALYAIPPADVSALIAEAREQGARMALEAAANKAEDVLFFHARRKRDATKAEVDAAKFYGRKAKESIRALSDDPAFIAKVRAG